MDTTIRICLSLRRVAGGMHRRSHGSISTMSVCPPAEEVQGHLLTMLRQTVKTPEIRQLVDTCSPRYREGFVTNVQKGDVPTR